MVSYLYLVASKGIKVFNTTCNKRMTDNFPRSQPVFGCQPAYKSKPFICFCVFFFFLFFALFVLFLPSVTVKDVNKLKMMILTREGHAKNLFPSLNTQQSAISLNLPFFAQVR